MNWGLVGFRGGEYPNIGGEVARQVAQPAVAERLGLSPEPQFVFTSKKEDGTPHSPDDFRDIDEFPEVTFVALPSTNDGELAKAYLDGVLDRGKVAVTAEKGALANFYPELRHKSENFRRLGRTATVGGGTRMLEAAEIYCADRDNVTQVHLALNGTLTYILSQIGPRSGEPSSLGQTVEQAVRLGYAEPGSSTPQDVIKSEAEGDTPKKTGIFFNSTGLSDEILDWRELQFELTDEEIERAVREAKIRRFAVSLYSKNHDSTHEDEDIVGGFSVNHDGWRIVGGFQHIDQNPLLAGLGRLIGTGNGAVFGLGPDEKDGVYTVTGPGAGVSPTANTMLDDWSRLRQLNHN